MRCEEARQLFDAYLDGELSPALTMELGAHRVHCPECRRALALMEVSGHIVSSDRDPITLRGGFTDRLMACVDKRSVRWHQRFRRGLYIGGPLAAAAVIVLAFAGVFTPGNGKVAGKKIEIVGPPPATATRPQAGPSADDSTVGDAARDSRTQNERLLEEWFEQTQKNIDAKRQSGESLQNMFRMTIRQLLDVLNEAQEAPEGTGVVPVGADPAAVQPREAPEAAEEEVEDM